MPETKQKTSANTSRAKVLAKDIVLSLVAIFYALSVLFVSRMGHPPFDTFKFVAWFVIPFACCVPWMDWGALGVRRLHKIDWLILGIAVVLGALAVLAVPLIPTLKASFPHIPPAQKSRYFWYMTIYNISWVPGWEFLHRYVLLRAASRLSPRFGWILVPISETVYHLSWSTLWMPAGMLLFSLVATRWTLARKNVLLPFVAHFTIETELMLFQIIG